MTVSIVYDLAPRVLIVNWLILKCRQQWEQESMSNKTGKWRSSAKEDRVCLQESLLTAKDCEVLENLCKLSGFFEDAVKILEGYGQQCMRKRGWASSYGNTCEVIQGYDFLLEVLGDSK